MKKILNFRYYFILAVSLIFMILFLYDVWPNFSSRFTISIIILFVTLLVSLLLIFFKRKSLVIALSILVFINCMTLNGLIREVYVNDNYSYNEKEITITGKIYSNFSYTSSENIKLVLDDVEVFSDDDYLKVKGKYVLYIEPSSVNTINLEVGRYVSAKVTANFYNYSNLSSKSNISNGIVGYSFCLSTDFQVKDKIVVGIKDKVLNFVYKKLSSLNLETSGIGLAMIFGNTDFIEDDDVVAFQNIGIAHLLAVSGLNVTIILNIFIFICNKLRVSSKIQFIVSLVILPIYMYLCDFSPSVVRACIMSIILLYANTRGKPYDKLSTLSFTASAILLTNPLKLYNYSFILSFSSTLAIILIYPKFKLVLKKFFYKGFADNLSLNLSIQVSLIFIQLYLFEYLPIFSVLSNLIIIPIVSVAFIVLLIGLAISIIPSFNLGLLVYDKIMDLVVKLGYYFNGLGSIITISNISLVTVILYYLLLFNLSDFLFLTKKTKLIIAVNIIIVCLIAQTLILL